MDCIVVAGGRLSPGEPLYPYGPKQPKALLEVGERTMLEMVVVALQASEYVDRVVVVGLEEEAVG
ncbi:MAG: NTP transferase domain-containing protein, partial [Candidatus Promineifilaceae bacterium]|nr:NTP transferase domain-containing protein [Candidatus Promineifilaceae bacterium]